ncbi:MAG: zinc-ribbon domain-containing protein [Phycisphaerae bacterium]
MRKDKLIETSQTEQTPEPTVEQDVPHCPRCEMEVSIEAEFCEHCGAKLGEHLDVPWWHLHRRLYDWVLAWAYRPTAAVALFVQAFAASSFFPIPPDVLLMPLVLGNRKRWIRYALICSTGSVLGAMTGFCIGWLAWGSGVDHLFYNYVPGFTPEVFNDVSNLYEEYNFWIVFTAGFTPIPFKVFTVTAGVFGTGEQVASPPGFFAVFVVAAVVSRSARFFIVAGLMRLFGPKITPFIDKYFNWLALLFTALLIGGFIAIKYAH